MTRLAGADDAREPPAARRRAGYGLVEQRDREMVVAVRERAVGGGQGKGELAIVAMDRVERRGKGQVRDGRVRVVAQRSDGRVLDRRRYRHRRIRRIHEGGARHGQDYRVAAGPLDGNADGQRAVLVDDDRVHRASLR